MAGKRSFLGEALALSLLLHAAAVSLAAGHLPLLLSARATPADITVWLREALPEAVAVPEPPRLTLPSPRALPANATPAARSVSPAPRLSGDAAQRATAQLRDELLYPPEAIARGLEGEAVVLLFLDAAGNAIAARLESSSGHALLDDAALRAARRLRELPPSAPREALLPVRFRLR
jgi:protein TonB